MPDFTTSIASIGGTGVQSRFRTPADVADESKRVRQLLATVNSLLGMPDVPSESDLDFQRCQALLAAAEEAVTHRLRSERNEAAWQRLLVILNQLHQSSVFLREAVLLDRSAAVVTIREALERLRSVTTVEQLAQRLPGEIGRLGFRRSLVSRVTDGVWVARYAFVDRDDELAELLVQAGSEEPSRLTTQLLETELVRRRRPMIVRDPQKNPRMHQKLKVATNTRCYVAAPVISGDHVIGFLHADEYLGGSAMDEFSRDLLGMFAEGVGHAIERTAFYERLQAIRGQLHDYSRGVNDLIDEFVSANVELHSTASEGAEPVSPRPARVLDPGFSAAPAASPLTRRELEILRHMASGATNAQIANRLVLSEGTVKSHVKHILRKLGAANRAQAVAHYHVLVQQGR